MLLDSIPLVPTKENGTDHPIIDIPVAAMLSSKDATKLRKLIEDGVGSSSDYKESLHFTYFIEQTKNLRSSVVDHYLNA